MNKQALLKQFQDDGLKLEFSKICDNVSLCLKRNEPVYSDFLDPHKAGSFLHVLQQARVEVACCGFGGYEGSERQIIGVAPRDMPLDAEDFPIEVAHIQYHAKFSRPLTHRDFLGALLGLSIERHLIGDIVLVPEGALAVLHRKMAGYVEANLDKVGRAGVKVRLGSWKEAAFPETEKTAKVLLLSSLRLDNVIAAAFHLSRSKAAALVDAEKVLVNWLPASSGAKNVAQGDTITLRGTGRIVIGQVMGTTKKDKFRLEIFT